MKKVLNIQEILIELINEAKQLKNSLQKEFEFLISRSTEDFVLTAKKRQIDSFDFIISQLDTVYENCNQVNQDLTENNFKIKCFLEQYGILPFELYLFLGASTKYIQNQTQYFKEEKIYRCLDPIRLKDDEPNKEIKVATKPVLNFTTLTKLAATI